MAKLFVAKDGAEFLVSDRADATGEFIEIATPGGSPLGTIRFPTATRSDCWMKVPHGYRPPSHMRSPGIGGGQGGGGGQGPATHVGWAIQHPSMQNVRPDGHAAVVLPPHATTCTARTTANGRMAVEMRGCGDAFKVGGGRGSDPRYSWRPAPGLGAKR